MNEKAGAEGHYVSNRLPRPLRQPSSHPLNPASARVNRKRRESG